MDEPKREIGEAAEVEFVDLRETRAAAVEDVSALWARALARLPLIGMPLLI